MKKNHDVTAKHFIALDSLRGLAAVTVMLFHVQWPNLLSRNPYVGHGFLLVDFFFVLSGFVIAYNYIDRISSVRSAGRFMWLRFWRLYPLHLFMLFVFLGIEILKYVAQSRYAIVANDPAFSQNDARSFLLNLFLAHGLFSSTMFSFNNVSWSISLEFFTYILFTCVVLTRRPILISALIVLIAGCIVARLNMQTVWRCPYGFFLGVLTFQIFTMIKRRFSASLPMQIVPVLAAILTVGTISYAGDAAFLLTPLVSALLISSVILIPGSAFVTVLNSRALVWLGTRSYSIYMTHAAILWGFDQTLRSLMGRLGPSRSLETAVPLFTGTALVLAFAVTTIAVSHFTYVFIEEPWRAWSKRKLRGREFLTVSKESDQRATSSDILR